MKRIIAILLLAVCLLTLGACKDSSKEYFPIAWEYVMGLPEGFPKLADAVTGAKESFGAGEVALYWNILSRDKLEGYLEQIEKWANAEFTAEDSDSNTFYSLDNGTYTVTAGFYPNASGNHLEAGDYDCNAKIIIKKK